MLKGDVQKGRISIGLMNGSFNLSDGKGTIFDLGRRGQIIFEGRAVISKGACITVADGASIRMGDGFSCNANFLCSCAKGISFGNNCLIGWNCTVIDGDGHNIFFRGAENEVINKPQPIVIGNNVWLASNVSVLKGAELKSGVVVGYGSVVTGKHLEDNSLLCSNNKVVCKKNNITWMR